MTQEIEKHPVNKFISNTPKDKKLPAMQFYPGDWRKDVGVQSLSFHDRGVWFEMLLLMHGSERRGVLVLNGQRMTDEMIARAIGLDNQTFNQTLTNLLNTGVACREESTCAVMNRRMVKDEYLRKVRAACGSKGGNPSLLNQKGTIRDKQNRTPSSSISPSLSFSEDETKALAESGLLNVVEALPLVDGTVYEITKDQIEKWSRAYPAVDAQGEIRKLNCWLDANPKKRKTRNGIARAIVNWLSRAQDRPTQNGGLNGNRAQHRTDKNIEAARRAAEAVANYSSDFTSGGAASRRQ